VKRWQPRKIGSARTNWRFSSPCCARTISSGTTGEQLSVGKATGGIRRPTLECGRHRHDSAVQSRLPQICRRKPVGSIRCDDGQGTSIIDISKLDFDSYVIGAASDHICPWPPSIARRRCSVSAVSSFWVAAGTFRRSCVRPAIRSLLLHQSRQLEFT